MLLPPTIEEIAPFLRRFAVPGGWIYEIDWKYDVLGRDSIVGVNHVFVPATKPAPLAVLRSLAPLAPAPDEDPAVVIFPPPSDPYDPQS